MRHNNKKSLKTPLTLAAIVLAANGLSGCIVAMPPAVQAASLALDGFSYISTGKSVSDHAISAVAQKDCAMLRALNNQPICEVEQQLSDLEVVDNALAKPQSDEIQASENLTTLAQPRWQPYTPRQRHLAQANTIDQIIMMSQDDDKPL